MVLYETPVFALWHYSICRAYMIFLNCGHSVVSGLHAVLQGCWFFRGRYTNIFCLSFRHAHNSSSLSALVSTSFVSCLKTGGSMVELAESMDLGATFSMKV